MQVFTSSPFARLLIILLAGEGHQTRLKDPSLTPYHPDFPVLTSPVVAFGLFASVVWVRFFFPPVYLHSDPIL